MSSFLGEKRWFAWAPERDTAAAIISALVMSCGGYYLLVHLPEGSMVQLVYRVIFELLLVTFPVYWICHHRKGSLAELGFKREGL
ncbi:MAG: hypothetical protein GYA23_03300, partial [Methanomicrobiales archaeon]|nr:hypothetical protein [Methanomicrobiales archaeon]